MKDPMQHAPRVRPSARTSVSAAVRARSSGSPLPIALLFGALTCLCSGSAAAQSAIGQLNVSWNDPDQGGKAVTALVFYPADTAGNGVPVASGDETFPVLSFGHGFQMQATVYAYLWQELVPRGYVFVAATTGGELFPDHQAFASDLAFLVRRLRQEGATPGSLFEGRIDPRAALIGHSMGGGAAVLAAAAEPTIDALVTLAAADTNPSSIAAAPGVTQAALTISGSLDCVVPPATQAAIHAGLASSCKWRANLIGATHCQFASQSSLCEFGQIFCSSPSLSRAQQNALTAALVGDWLDGQLLSSGEAWAAFLARVAQNDIADEPGCVLVPGIESIQGGPAAAAGEVWLQGPALGLVLGAEVAGLPAPILAKDPEELRLGLAIAAPGFQDLVLTHPQGSLTVPSAVPRFPALHVPPAGPGEVSHVTLATGGGGPFLLAWSTAFGGPFALEGIDHLLELAAPALLVSGAAAFEPIALPIPIPADPGLSGLSLPLQALALASTGPSFSNAAALIVP